MKAKLIELAQSYLKIVIAFLPTILLIRLGEYLSLSFYHAVPPNTLEYLWSGFLLDIAAFFTCALLVAVLFLLVGLIHSRTARIVAITLLCTYTILSIVLVKYFTTTMIPMDQVIFNYTSQEIVSIVLSSTKISVVEIIFIASILITPIVLLWLLKGRTFAKPYLYVLLALLVDSPIILKAAVPKQKDFHNDFEYYLRISKPLYLMTHINEHQSNLWRAESKNPNIKAIVQRFQKSNPQFTYINPDFPFLRKDETPDVLSNYLNLSKDPPNLVFIIVESLSTSFLGDQAFYGNFMPFLDSLSKQSLYWNNFLSSAERTFNVLPAVFASVPYCNGIFNQGDPPFHFSMIRYLKENGYQTNFFYGGDPHFSGYDFFLKHQDIDYILRHFGPKYGTDVIREKSFEWGYPDGDLYQRAFEVLDSIPINPRLDIYLTLSSHAPFAPPHKEHYLEQVESRLQKLPIGEDRKKMVEIQRDIFSSILYTDQALREFFNRYKKREDFANTIFFITGDHAMPELNYTYLNIIERYHVPFIIYSPMLTKAQQFSSVSSHYDVTPSVLALLKYKGFITTKNECTWIGSGIDVTERFQNLHKMSFIYNNGVQAEYIDGENYLSVDRYFQLLPHFQLQHVDDTVTLIRLKEQLSDYLAISQDVLDRKELMPTELFLSSSYRTFSNTGLNPMSFTGYQLKNTYIQLAENKPLNDNYDLLRLEIALDLKMIHQGDSLPSVILQITNPITHKDVGYYRYEFNSTPDKRNPDSVQVRTYIDVSGIDNLRNQVFKLYLYNEHEKAVRLNSLKLEVTGYKKNNHQKK